jgi:nitrogen PTS system EIIA component
MTCRTMSVKDLIKPEDVVAGLRVADKAQLLTELGKLAGARIPVSSQAIFSALSDRERLGSTGLGRGFALPHARIEGVDRLFGMFVRLARPIDFQAIDGRPVDLIFLLLMPPQAAGEHVAALAAISRDLRDEKRLEKLRRANSAAALHQALTEIDAAASRTA